MTVRPSDHWICLSCRKQFRKPSASVDNYSGALAKPKPTACSPCPECKAPLIDMGRYFRAPRRADRRAWEQVRLLAEHGVRLTYEESVHYLSIIAGRRSRQTQSVIYHCSCHTRTEGQVLLKKISRNRERLLRRK